MSIKRYLCFSMVCVPFALPPMTLFYKAWAWVALSLNLKRTKARACVGLKNELGLTPCKVQWVGLWAFASGVRFVFKTQLYAARTWLTFNLSDLICRRDLFTRSKLDHNIHMLHSPDTGIHGLAVC